MMSLSLGRRLAAAIVSLILLGLVFWKSGWANVLNRLAGFPPWAIGDILILLWANLFIVSFRFWRVLAHFGIALPWKVASRACVAGHAAGLVVISLFGQVLGRQAVLQKFGVSPVVNAALAAYERTSLAFVSGSIGVLGGFYLLGHAMTAEFFRRISIAEVAIAGLGAGILSYWLGQSRFEAKLYGQIISATNFRRIGLILAITLAGQFMVLGCFVLGIWALHPQVPAPSMFAAAAVISLAASVPITVNGWGVRELAAVYVLGKLNIPAADAVAVSLLVGLCSTLVILSAVPFFNRTLPVGGVNKPIRMTMHSASEIEKAAAWILAMAVAVAVFFQVHLDLPGGVVNLNLADPFAILALAAVSLDSFFLRSGPGWRIKHFNMALIAISLLLLFGFIRGWLEIGITQWALGNRLLGWLVLLGYLSAGYLIVANAGSHGRRRLAETLVATVAIVVAMQVGLRLLNNWGIDIGAQFTPNFEGYAGNRNAFAFQLLVVMALILGYSRVYARSAMANKGSARTWVFAGLLGVVLAAVAWSGSRAGLLTSLVILLVAGGGRLADRKTLGCGLLFAAALWVGVWLGALHAHVQSSLSGDISDQERWATFTHAVELWYESPVFGAGLGLFIAKSASWLGHPQVIHNTALWVLAEFGLVGIAVMGWVFFLLARHAVGLGTFTATRGALLLLLLAFTVFSLAHEIFYQRIFWFVLGAILAQPHVSKGRT